MDPGRGSRAPEEHCQVGDASKRNGIMLSTTLAEGLATSLYRQKTLLVRIITELWENY